ITPCAHSHSTRSGVLWPVRLSHTSNSRSGGRSCGNVKGLVRPACHTAQAAGVAAGSCDGAGGGSSARIALRRSRSHGCRTALVPRAADCSRTWPVLRHDPVLAVLAGKLTARRSDCAPLAGKSTLNRLEHAPSGEPSRYHRIGHDGAAIARVFVDLFLEAHARAPKQIILDLDATDDPLHGHQEGRFFHGYYDCHCYLPLYVFCGRHLLAAKLRRSNIDASAGAEEEVARIVRQIRARWPRVKIVLRADSGFAREALMLWCERSRVDFVFGLARNARLETRIAAALQEARTMVEAAGRPARVFRDFLWSTKETWSRRRRVIAKAE